jgi:hypothetical protein
MLHQTENDIQRKFTETWTHLTNHSQCVRHIKKV